MFFPPVFLHRLAQNTELEQIPVIFFRMLSFDKIIFNFILSCFKTQPFCFHIIAALQLLSALQQASLILKGYLPSNSSKSAV